MTEIKITRIQRNVKKKQGCLFRQTFGGRRDREKQLRHVICRAVLLRLVLCPLRAAADKRKSDGPCRWVIAFLVPCGTGRVNDKKVNEENSNLKNKGFGGERKTALRGHVSNGTPLLDTTYHFSDEITSPFFDFSPIIVRKIAFLEKRTNLTKSSRQTDEQA